MFKPLSLRVLSIDPGFNNMGVSFNTLNYHTGIQVIEYCNTFNIPKLAKDFKESSIINATNYLVNASVVRTLVSNLLNDFTPDVVVCEAAFLGRFPQAFASLTLCLNAIESAVYDYDYDVGFFTFDPPTVKVQNGVKGNSNDKEEMKQAILHNPSIVSAQDLTHLDEHSFDAIGIGHCYFKITF